MLPRVLSVCFVFLVGLSSCNLITQDSNGPSEAADSGHYSLVEYPPGFEKTSQEYQNYQELKLLFDSLGRLQSEENYTAVLQIRINLADLLRQTGNYQYGINLLEENLRSTPVDFPDKLKGESLNGLSAIYFELYMHFQKKAYLDSCWHYALKTNTLARLSNSHALLVDALTLQGAVLSHTSNYPAANALLNEAYQISTDQLPDPPLAVMTNLAWTALKTGDYDLAMSWINRCYEAAEDSESNVFIGTALKIKADIYAAQGQYEQELEVKGQLQEHIQQDDILFQSLMMKELVVQQEMNSYKQTMLGLYQEKYFLIRLSFILLFLSLILVVVALGVFKLLRQQKRLRQKEQELTLSQQKEDALKIDNAALELTAKEAEQNALKAKLDLQEQELIFQSLKQIYYNQLTQAIRDKLGPFRLKLSRKKDQEQYERALHEVCQEASHDPLAEFEQIFLQMHSGFYEKLLEINPTFSRSELQMCALLRMNLPSKEIASLLFLSLSTVDQKRHQIRKKLGLDSNQNLNSFLIAL